MAQPVCPDVIVYICRNCVGDGRRLPRQWQQNDAHVVVREVPCSGKMDAQYLLNALEAGGDGLCVVACPKGQCQLVQGNYRAEVRIGTVKRLLEEIGLQPQRAELVHGSPDDPPERFEQLVRDAVQRIGALGKSPLGVQTHG